MPCMKCANGKWKYGEHGNCQFNTLAACNQAATAIHIQENDMKPKTPAMPMAEPKVPAKKPKKPGGAIDVQPAGPHVPAMPPAATYSQQNDMTPIKPPSTLHDAMCSCSMCLGYRM